MSASQSVIPYQRDIFQIEKAIYEIRKLLKKDHSLLSLVQSQRGEVKSDLFHLRHQNQISLSLESLEESLRNQEIHLAQEVSTKEKQMKRLAEKKKKALAQLKKFREQFSQNSLPSFLEQRGKLSLPCQRCSLEKKFHDLTKNSVILPHQGHTYRLPLKESVESVFRGQVVWTSPIEGYGKTVILRHPKNYYTVYAGLETVQVSMDQLVSKKQTLGQHKGLLYFEIREFDEAVDPARWLQRQ